MKPKGSPKKNMSVVKDKFDRKSAKVKALNHKDRGSKRRLSIYDEFNEEDETEFDYDTDNVMENPFDD